MTTIVYDGTFEGFLTVIFDLYEKKLQPEIITTQAKFQPQMFEVVHEIVSVESNAKRVWKGICGRLSSEGQKVFYYTFLSNTNDIEILLFRFVKKILATTKNIEQDFGDPDVLEIWKIAKKVGSEIHKISMFVRFQKTADGIYYASFNPRYDILHLATDHFKDRFANQRWIIYDTGRNYGYYYDCDKVTEVVFTESSINIETGRLRKEMMAEEEQLFQDLWKIYFKEISIVERINLKQQRQHMPKRFWKYLVEKW